jgi:hypothetical protein
MARAFVGSSSARLAAKNILSFGRYSEITLQDARERRLEARRMLAHGVDPAKHRDDVKRIARERAANTFEKIAREWHANKVPTWSARTAKNVIDRLEADIVPTLGRKPIDEMKHCDLLAALRKIQDRGANEIAHRQKAVCSQIFSYAIQCGFTDRNLVVDMKDVLKTTRPARRLRSNRRRRTSEVPGGHCRQRCAPLQANAHRISPDSAYLRANQRID